jgi:uncharacterized YccA/Bax inhibitor family protein
MADRVVQTSNPALSGKAFEKAGMAAAGEQAMTAQGSINKTLFFLILCVLSSSFVWNIYYSGQLPLTIGLAVTGLIGGLVTALITIFYQKATPVTGTLYALFEGLVIGAVSASLDSVYKGVVGQAVLMTFGVLFVMLALYTSKVIKVTEKLKMGIVAATGAVVLVYIIDFILGFFHMSVPGISVADKSMFSIGVSVVIVAIAAFNLVLDFDFIEKGSQGNLPKYMEWYAAFGLMVTLLWLYLEALRLLGKLRR